jgi:hypothetical protein
MLNARGTGLNHFYIGKETTMKRLFLLILLGLAFVLVVGAEAVELTPLVDLD